MESLNYDRTKKIGALIQDTERKADELYEEFKPFTDGIRIILLVERKKDGGGSNKPQKHAMRFITQGTDSYYKYLQKALFLQETLNLNGSKYRVYSSVNPRNMQKGILHFKHEQVDSEHGDMTQCHDWYRDIQDRFIGALMKPGSKAGSRFLIDIDGDQQLVGEVLKQIAQIGVDIVYQYATKNGWHIITEPFNPTMFTPMENVEIKPDSLLAISF